MRPKRVREGVCFLCWFWVAFLVPKVLQRGAKGAPNEAKKRTLMEHISGSLLWEVPGVILEQFWSYFWLFFDGMLGPRFVVFF